ncbi:MAG: hypothetical protein AABX86_02435, partial [Nanoarchaeota archaeon]
ERFVNIDDARVREQVYVIVKQPLVPVAEGLSFYRTDEHLYQSTFVPEKEGIFTLLGATYAVNYPREYEYVGMHPPLADVVASTGGQMFIPDQISEIAQAVVRQSKQPVDERHYYRWVPLLAALFLFLLDIFVRKTFENKKRNALHTRR